MSGRERRHKRRVLMTVDAVGGVWRYAVDLAAGLRVHGIETIFAGLGPQPLAAQICEAEATGKLVWLDASLDWMVEDEASLSRVPQLVADLAVRECVDLVHLNLPSQAAGLEVAVPVVVVSHSCVTTWFAAVRGQPVPQDWQWQMRLNRQGFDRADAVLAPSRSHAAMLHNSYGLIVSLQVVANASRVNFAPVRKQEWVFAAGRWWDEGKNGAVLDAAAEYMDWPLVMAGADRGPNGQRLTLRHADHRGERSHGEVMTLMGQSAITVSPSIYEPFGLAALEAARMGSALVLADIPTYREFWNGAALFADPDDAQAFADAVNRLAADRKLREALAASALQRSRGFTIEAQAAAVERVYSRLLPQMSALTAAE